MHHDTLCSLLFRRIRDRDTRRLVEQIVSTGRRVYETPLAIEALGLDAAPLPPGAGLPIGSAFSQWSGALYLDGLDHFVLRDLRIGAYLRFMDDFVLFHDDPARLRDAREAIAAWLASERRLTLNPKHGAVHSTAEPFTALGYRVSRAGLTPGPKMRRRMRRKLLEASRAGPAAFERTILAYRGSVVFG